MQCDPRRDRRVERLHLARLMEFHEARAGFPHGAGHALLFTADDDDHRARDLDFVKFRLRVRCQTENLDSCIDGAVERAVQRAHSTEGRVFDRSRACAKCHGRERSGTRLAPEHGRPCDSDRTSDGRPEVVRIDHPIERYRQEPGIEQDLLPRSQVQRWREGQDALMLSSLGEAIEVSSLDRLHFDTLVTGESLDRGHSRGIALLNDDPVRLRAPDANHLAHGLVSKNEPLPSRVEAIGVSLLARLGPELCSSRLQEQASSIAARRVAAALFGSWLSRMGRPTTSTSAPARMASPGVPTRF